MFFLQVEEKNAVIQRERSSELNELLNTLACVKRQLNKYKPETLVFSVEKLEKQNEIIFKLLQREQSAGESKSLKTEKENSNSSRILQISPFLNDEGLIRAKS